MHSTRSICLVSVACAVASAGCQFSASASGEAKAGGESHAEGEASFQTGQPEGEASARTPAIRYQEGKLDYEGVINFEYNRAEIRSDADTQKTLSEFKKFLEKNPDVKISVEGHTDSRGSDDYNRKLSDRRAASVKKWLNENGIKDERVTSVGKGEDAPQVPEPDECNDKEPDDTAPCEGPWAKNRRVVFEVTEGGDTIKQAEPAPAEATPEPAPAPAPPPEKKRCRVLVGPRLGILGPNSWANINVAVQPCLDWLELSLGAGLGLGNMDASSGAIDADGSYWSITVPLRARIYPFRVHSPIADLGIGITHYDISSSAESGGASYDWERTSTPWIAHLGLGYGFRPNGPEPGLRLGIMVGALFHLNDLKGSDVTQEAGFPAANGTELTDDLDGNSDDLTDLEPYGELSVGWLF
jgi:outer membrane protein OmpA-like peptidoglycan-associated protein